MEIHGTQNSQNNLVREEKVGGLALLNFRTYYKPAVIKIVWYLP